MFWIFGGAYNVGGSTASLFDGRHLAEKGVVVVTFNYRLGALGFLAHPLLSRESPNGVSGNYGLLDQIEALKWVQRNIGSFGGDKDQVTIFGESAGAMSVMNLLVSPLSEGLFARAIMESSPFLDTGLLMPDSRSLASGEQVGLRFASALGCDLAPDVLTAMRTLTVDQIFNFLPLQRQVFITGPLFVPVVDGWALPDQPGVLFSQGKRKNVPLMVGSNADEANIFVYGIPLTKDELEDLTMDQYTRCVKQFYGPFSDRVLARFPVNDRQPVKPVLAKLMTVMDFTAAARFAAGYSSESQPATYLYEFRRVPPKDKLGAFHGIEIAYVFGNLLSIITPAYADVSWYDNVFYSVKKEVVDLLALEFDPVDFDLSRDMVSYWTNFAKTGDPNGEGLVKWPRYGIDSGEYISFGDRISVRSNLEVPACELEKEFYLSGFGQ